MPGLRNYNANFEVLSTKWQKCYMPKLRDVAKEFIEDGCKALNIFIFKKVEIGYLNM